MIIESSQIPFLSNPEKYKSMKFHLLSLCLVFALSQKSIAENYPVSDPNNSGGWELIDSVSDEFNGNSLNLNKWNNLGLNDNYHGEWKGRAPSQYNPKNISVSGGYLTLTSKWDPGFNFSNAPCSNGMKYGKPAPVTTAAIITKAKFKYGYMEMRCKAADGPVSSSFWSTGKGGEIDVFEHFGKNLINPFSGSRYHCSFHDWRKNSKTFAKRVWTNDHTLDFRVADDFHVYGLDWNEKFLKIYVDGMLVKCSTRQEIGDKWVADAEQKVWIDSETFDWELHPSKLKASDFGNGQKFVIDYCRIWQSKKSGVTCKPRKNLIRNPSFESSYPPWKGTVEIFGDSQSGSKAAVHKVPQFLEQTVDVKPNTTYVLSAWAKSPETNEKNLWFNAFLGVRGQGIEERKTRFFFPYYHEKSLQFTTGPHTKSVFVYFTNKPHGKTAVVDNIKLVQISQ